MLVLVCACLCVCVPPPLIYILSSKLPERRVYNMHMWVPHSAWHKEGSVNVVQFEILNYTWPLPPPTSLHYLFISFMLHSVWTLWQCIHILGNSVSTRLSKGLNFIRGYLVQLLGDSQKCQSWKEPPRPRSLTEMGKLALRGKLGLKSPNTQIWVLLHCPSSHPQILLFKVQRPHFHFSVSLLLDKQPSRNAPYQPWSPNPLAGRILLSILSSQYRFHLPKREENHSLLCITASLQRICQAQSLPDLFLEFDEEVSNGVLNHCKQIEMSHLSAKITVTLRAVSPPWVTSLPIEPWAVRITILILKMKKRSFQRLNDLLKFSWPVRDKPSVWRKLSFHHTIVAPSHLFFWYVSLHTLP